MSENDSTSFSQIDLNTDVVLPSATSVTSNSTTSVWAKKSSALLQTHSQVGSKTSDGDNSDYKVKKSMKKKDEHDYHQTISFDKYGGLDPEVYEMIEKEVKDLSEKEITEVHVDSGVYFNLVKNIQRKDTISGVLLGSQQGNHLEVTYHFQLPSHKSKSGDQNLKINKFQTKYLKNIKPFQIDNNIVGWYQSSSYSSFFSFESFQQQFIHEKFLNNVGIMLVIEKKTRSFQLRAYRLSKSFLKYIQDSQRQKSEGEEEEEKEKISGDEDPSISKKLSDKRSLQSILKDLEMKIYNNYFPNNLEKEHFDLQKFSKFEIYLLRNFFQEIPVSITNTHGQLEEEFLQKNFANFKTSTIQRTPNTSNYMSQLILNYKIFQQDATERKENSADLDLILTTNKLKNNADDLKKSYANELVSLFLLKNLMKFED